MSQPTQQPVPPLPQENVMRQPSKPSSSFRILIVILIVSISLGASVLYWYDDLVTLPSIARFFSAPTPSHLLLSDRNPIPTNAPTPTPTSIILKPDDGTKGTYAVSQSSNSKGPTIQKVIFNPLDAQKGQTLTITVVLSSPDPILHVGGTLMSDAKEHPLTFTQTEIKGSQSVWVASYQLDDTVLYTYILSISASTVKGDSTVRVAPRS